MPYADKETQLKYLKNWRKENPEYGGNWFRANRNKMKQWRAVWFKNNRQAFNKRRKEREQQGGHTEKEWEFLKAKYLYTCLMCKRIEPDIRLLKDHIKPLWLGGTNNISNIQPLCKICNFKKSNATLDLRS